MNRYLSATLAAVLLLAYPALGHAQTASYAVTLVPPDHGSVQLTPPLPADGKYPAGSVVKVTATPEKGYALDSVWYSVPGRFGQMSRESMAREFAVTVDQDKRIGASFVAEAAVKDITVKNDIVYAKPGVKPLKYDVFRRRARETCPSSSSFTAAAGPRTTRTSCGASRASSTKGGKFVVASMDYRWPGNATATNNRNTMADLIDDVFGGIAQSSSTPPSTAGTRPDRRDRRQRRRPPVGGGVAHDEHDRIRGFGKTAGVFEFMPSYLPKGKSAEQVREKCRGDQSRGAELRRVRRRRC